MLGTDDLTKVGIMVVQKVRRVCHLGLEINEFAYFLADGFVEINEELILLLEERTDVIHVIVKERTLAISRLKGIPMDSSPLVVVADAQILEQDFFFAMLYRNGQSLHTIGGCNDTAVAESLFLVRVVLLNETLVVATQLLIPLYGSEVCGL